MKTTDVHGRPIVNRHQALESAIQEELPTWAEQQELDDLLEDAGGIIDSSDDY